jgi:hypothetical protein
LGNCSLWAVFLKITEAAQSLALHFSTVKVVYQFCKEMGWDIFWVIFLQTHLVTLQVVLTAGTTI